MLFLVLVNSWLNLDQFRSIALLGNAKERMMLEDFAIGSIFSYWIHSICRTCCCCLSIQWKKGPPTFRITPRMMYPFEPFSCTKKGIHRSTAWGINRSIDRWYYCQVGRGFAYYGLGNEKNNGLDWIGMIQKDIVSRDPLISMLGPKLVDSRFRLDGNGAWEYRMNHLWR